LRKRGRGPRNRRSDDSQEESGQVEFLRMKRTEQMKDWNVGLE